MRSVPRDIAEIRDDGERFRAAQAWSDLVGGVKADIAPLRQDAFRAFKSSRGLTLERAAQALGISFGTARRIMSGKLKRDRDAAG